MLWIASSLITTYPRYEMQYGHPPWHDGFLGIIIGSFAHFIGIGLLAVFVAYGSTRFFPCRKDEPAYPERWVQAIEIVCLTLVVLSIYILLYMHALHFGSDESEGKTPMIWRFIIP